MSDKLYALANGTINKLNVDGNKTESINISYTFRRNLLEEFDQMFYEAWAQLDYEQTEDWRGGLHAHRTQSWPAKTA